MARTSTRLARLRLALVILAGARRIKDGLRRSIKPGASGYYHPSWKAPCSLSLRGTSGERAGERGTFHRIGAANGSPLSLTLSPLLRRGERESTSGMVVSRCPIKPGGCKSQAQSGRVAVRTLAGPGQRGIQMYSLVHCFPQFDWAAVATIASFCSSVMRLAFWKAPAASVTADTYLP